ncbi:MAG: two-component system sensor histidine kinase RegB [Bradyrhizobium sp.]|jgi:two-component system sensor histidine kinase RegB
MNLIRMSDISESLQALSTPLGGANVESNAGHSNMLLLIQLRWIAVVGQITTITVVIFGFHIALPLMDLLKVLACLVIFNIASHLRWRVSRVVTNRELFFALLVDAAALTGLLYLTGGTTNPFAFLYLLQVILGAVLLEAWSTWVFVGITSTCLACLSLYAKPLILTSGPVTGLSNLYIEGMLLCFALNASLLVFFVSRINRNLRSGAAQLADLRQHAAEEAHIVRMGLLASGAAHELGTPLATLSVILGDWRRMPEFRKNIQLLDELGEMQAQLKRCKTIVSGVLMSAGEARSESSIKTTICTFLDELVLEWRATRPVVVLDYSNHIEQDLPVVFDSALKQMICNVLDNAFESSPAWLRFEAMREDGVLRLVITDAGSGFPAQMLTHFGKPYQSTKGRPGGGLGLFFSVNVVRKLGGVVHARNLAQGGALVQVTLPLAAISLE